MTSATRLADGRLALVALAIFAGSCERVSWLSGPPRPLEPSPSVATTDDCSTTPTWESFGQGFLRTWCTPCHSSGLPEGARQGAPLGVDFDTYASTLAFAGRLVPVAGSAGSSMPPAGGPSAEERARLLEWVRCDLPGVGSSSLACTDPVERTGPIEAGPSLCDDGDVHIRGDLTITDDTAPCVCAVDGTLTAVGSVQLPELQQAGAIDARMASQLSAPRLAALQGDLLAGGDIAELDLPELTTIRGSLHISQAPLLSQVDFTLLSSVGDLVIDEAELLTDFRPRRLRSVVGDLRLQTVGLQDLGGFDSLHEVGGDLHLADLPAVHDIAGFPLLTRVDGSLLITGLADLVGIEGLDALEELGGDLHIEGVPSLRALTGINALEAVGGDATLTGPTALEALRGLSSLQQAQHLTLVDHPSLRTTPGLSQLERAGISLVDLPALSRTPAPRLVEADAIEVVRVSLTVLDGWDGVTSTEALFIEENPFLSQLDGLSQLGSVSGDAVLRDNLRWPPDLAWSFADGLDVEGALIVEGNGVLAD